MDSVPFLLTVEFDGGTELLRPAARVQIAARKLGFKPTWLVGAEALRHPSALEPLARWQRDGEAEVGALIEAAAVPPLVDLGALAEGRRPFLTDFPESVMDEKLAWYSATLGQLVGRPPTAIRCSRPSVDDRYYTLLAKNGFRVDLTVVPHAKVDTSDFTAYPEKAYLTPQGVFEVPRTVRRRKYGPFVEDLLVLPGLAGQAARWAFPTLRCFRLRRGNGSVVKTLVREGAKALPSHFDLRISSRDWARGDSLVRELERVLAAVQTFATGLSAEEYLQRFKNEQLRKDLL
jgi:hypothetical protein